MIDKFVFFGEFENCIANADAAIQVAQNIVLKVCFALCEKNWKLEGRMIWVCLRCAGHVSFTLYANVCISVRDCMVNWCWKQIYVEHSSNSGIVRT